jgi:hypothetical protein
MIDASAAKGVRARGMRPFPKAAERLADTTGAFA